MSKNYEVIILGSGISGSLLAAVLARSNVRVAIIDSGTHPRFAIGEATVPETTTNLRIMGQLFDVPEIAQLGSFFEQRDRVGSSHGIKRGFSFCYHRDNQRHIPEETTQTGTLSPPFGPDSHWFRQDTDQYMLGVAARYGADVYQQTTVSDFTLHDDGVEVISDKGPFRAQFLVDASGPFSPFARKMQIRETPTRLMTKSRGIFTHMVGVGRYDDQVGHGEHGMPYPLDQTTLHHIFPGGWMWVIPFNNHAQATNDLCSVGVMFECEKSPKTDATPEEEFEAFLARYPSIGAQFANARSVRKWVSSPRIQYSSTKLWEGRYFALPHAAAFIDPLFSTGLNLTAHAVTLLGDALVDSFRSGVLQTDKLKTVEGQVLHKIAIYDKLVATSFKAFRSFELWNAWYRVWEIGTYFSTLGAMRCLLKYEETGDAAHLRARFDRRYASPLGCSVQGYVALFDNMAALVDEVDRGEIDEAAGVKAMYDELARFPAMPAFINRRKREDRTIGSFTVPRLMRMFAWGKTRGPDRLKHYYDFSLITFIKVICSNLWSYRRRFARVAGQPWWDMFLERTSNQPINQLGVPTRVDVRALRVPAGAEQAVEMPAATNGRAADVEMETSSAPAAADMATMRARVHA
ncbi:MAG: tryptophan 7-halogenase [Minicystis sp.]